MESKSISTQELLEYCENISPGRLSKGSMNYSWVSSYTSSVLKCQLCCISILTWLLIVLYGSNFAVQTSLTSEWVPLWALWIVAVYALSVSVAVSFNFHPSPLGVFISGLLQVMTMGFSAYFTVISMAALETHGRLDKNDMTRMWGGLLYGTTVVANAGILLTSFLLILSATADTCRKPKGTLHSFIQTA